MRTRRDPPASHFPQRTDEQIETANVLDEFLRCLYWLSLRIALGEILDWIHWGGDPPTTMIGTVSLGGGRSRTELKRDREQSTHIHLSLFLTTDAVHPVAARLGFYGFPTTMYCPHCEPTNPSFLKKKKEWSKYLTNLQRSGPNKELVKLKDEYFRWWSILDAQLNMQLSATC